jgi:hypothetical protein
MSESDTTHAPPQALTHAVYFTLIDDSPEQIRALIDSCVERLSGHPGTLFFAVGARTPDLSREVNDQEFHVGLQVIFDSRRSHDAYFDSPRHLQFLEESRSNWARVRIFNCDAAMAAGFRES